MLKVDINHVGKVGDDSDLAVLVDVEDHADLDGALVDQVFEDLQDLLVVQGAFQGAVDPFVASFPEEDPSSCVGGENGDVDSLVLVAAVALDVSSIVIQTKENKKYFFKIVFF